MEGARSHPSAGGKHTPASYQRRERAGGGRGRGGGGNAPTVSKREKEKYGAQAGPSGRGTGAALFVHKDRHTLFRASRSGTFASAQGHATRGVRFSVENTS